MDKICPVCGTSFETQKKNKIYCCEACGNRALRRKKMGRSISDVDFKKEYNALKVICICPICGKEFEKHPNNRMLYCSEECQIIGQKAYKHEYGKEYNKKYHEEHKEERSAKRKQYRQEHLEEQREKERQREKKYAVTNPKRRARAIQRSLIIRCLNCKKLDKSSNILGYTAGDLIKWIESQFYNGMSWDNRELWEIHHIIPINEFNTTNEDGSDNYNEIAKANTLSNLIPLFKKDHRVLTNLYRSENKYLTREEIYDIFNISRRGENFNE